MLRSFVLLLLLFAVRSHGQTLRGTVKDSAGKAVPYATVNLRKTAASIIIKYTVTDGNGGFLLQLPRHAATDSLSIEVRSMGYQTAVKNIVQFDAPVDIVMAASFNELQGVVIEGQKPVLRARGDTLIYRVSDFSNPQDRVIGDVLKRMPGITIGSDGTIRYNNKTLSAVYIGGDNLLDDKYSIATNSIPWGAVSQVQVIQNEQPIKLLQNKVLSEEVALNLEIKKGAKLHVMGQESIGIGLPGKYDIDLNAMFFKDKYKAINYFKTNNTGDDLQQEITSHNTLSSQQRIDNAIPAPLLSLGSVNNPALEGSRYLFNRSAILNLNNLVTLPNKVQLKLNAYYLRDSQTQEYKQQTSIFLPGDTVHYNETQRSRFAPILFHTQFTININREKYYLNDVLLMDLNNSGRYANLQTDSSKLNQELTARALNFSNELNILKSFGSHIIQFYSYTSHSSGPENRVIDPGYNAAIFNNTIPYAQLIQQVNVPGWYTNNYMAFRLPSRWVTQSFRTGFSVQSQMLSSALSVVQNNNNTTVKDSAVNQLNWSRKKIYAEASYDLPGEVLKANLTLPLVYQQISYNDDGFALHRSLNRLYFNPQLNIKYQVDVQNYLSLSCNYRNQAGTIGNVYPGYILTDYRTLAANSGSLTEQSTQQVTAGFSHSKALTLFFWSINASYNHTRANNIASSVVSNNIQKGIVLPYPNAVDAWSVGGSISKYSFVLRSTFSASMQWQSSRSVQIQNGALLPFTTNATLLSGNVDTKFSNNISLSYKGTVSQVRSYSLAETSGYRVNQLLQQMSIQYNPVDQVQCALSGDHYFTKQRSNSDLNYFFADASVKFKVNRWKTDFYCSAVNFLNTKTYGSVYLTANTFATSSYVLPGRVLVLKVMFRL